MTNFIQKTHLDIGFSAFNCLLDSQCSLLTSQILGSCSKLKWSNRAYAVYWLRGTLLYPWGNMDNILDKRDSKGKVGGGRKEQKVWVPWKEEKCEEEWQAEHRWCLQFLPWSKDETRGQGEEGRWEQSKTWERKETKDEEQKESLKILRNISPFLHQHLTLATLALIITVIFFQRRCRRSPLRMSASRNSPWPLQPSSRSK